MQDNEESWESNNPFASPAATLAESVELPPEDYAGQPFHPFQTIWTSPRKTIRRIVATDSTLHVTLLACLAGIAETLDRASTKDAGDKIPLAAIFGMALVLGPLGGLLSLWIGSHLVRITGSWMGGQAPREHIKAAIAWASVPSIATLPVWGISLILLGSEMFTAETPSFDDQVEAQPLLWIPFVGIALVGMVMSIWGWGLISNTIAEVQGFRLAWAGLGNMILAGLVLLVPLVLLIFVMIFATQG